MTENLEVESTLFKITGIWIVAFILVLNGLLMPSQVYAGEKDFFGSWNGRISVTSSGVDNDRVSDGQEILQNYLLRLIKEGDLNDSTEYQFHLMEGFTLSTMNTGFSGFSSGFSPEYLKYRCVDLNYDILSEPKVNYFLSVDRCNLRYRFQNADLTIGRQAITYGRAWFWNPLDVYLPFDAQSIDREYKAGVDALRLEIPLGTYSGIDFVAAAGSRNDFPELITTGNDLFKCDWYGSSVLAHYFTNKSGWDYTIQGGKVYGGYQLGGGLVGEIGEFQFRGEGIYFFAEDSRHLEAYDKDLYEDHVEFAVGLGRYFRNNLNVDFEYFHNGAADPDRTMLSYTRLIKGANRHISRDLAGLNITYELDPLLTGQIATIYSFDDSSFSFQPFLTYSVSNDATFLVGASLNFGDTPRYPMGMPVLQSEFGSYPNSIYAEYRFYF